MHTFSLKAGEEQAEPSVQSVKTMTAATVGNQEKSVRLNNQTLQSAMKQKDIMMQKEEKESRGKHRDSSISISTDRRQSGSPGRVFYVEEKIKLLEGTLRKVDPILEEINKRISEYFGLVGPDMNEAERNRVIKHLSRGNVAQERRRRGLSFGSEEEIRELKENSKFRLNARNMLGVRHKEDWVFNLNIGNVMHLSAMSFDELLPPSDKTHELNKDAMLEKIILLVVGLFCVSTEIRFLSQEKNEDGTSKGYSKKDSEMWHAQSLLMGALFLPWECPLVSHVISSYNKHHLRDKPPPPPPEEEEVKLERDTPKHSENQE